MSLEANIVSHKWVSWGRRWTQQQPNPLIRSTGIWQNSAAPSHQWCWWMFSVPKLSVTKEASTWRSLSSPTSHYLGRLALTDKPNITNDWHPQNKLGGGASSESCCWSCLSSWSSHWLCCTAEGTKGSPALLAPALPSLPSPKGPKPVMLA